MLIMWGERLKGWLIGYANMFLRLSFLADVPMLPNKTDVALIHQSAIAEHLFNSPECASTFTPGLFSILAKARNTLHLHVLKAFYIKMRRPSLCNQRELLFKLRL